MSESVNLPLGEIAVRITKGTTPTSIGARFGGEISFIKVESLKEDGRIDRNKAATIDERTHGILSRSQLQEDDILFSIAGTIGRVARVGREVLPANTNQALAIIRPDRSRVDVGYLYYALRDTNRVTHAASRVVQSVQANLSLAQLSAVTIPIPSLAVQRAIAEVLGALDDKIAANTKLAELVDEYLSTFLRDAIADLHDWTTLDSIATVNQVSIKPEGEGSLRYVDIASVGIGEFDYPSLSPWADAPGRARRKVKRGDTLWSTVRPNRRSHALNLSDDSTLVASTGLAVLTPSTAGFAYLYEVTRLPEFTAYLENVAEGSAYPAVRADRFKSAPIPAISDDKRLRFESIATPMREHVHSLREENRTLAATRDALLPQLMSGRLRVRDAESLVADAV